MSKEQAACNISQLTTGIWMDGAPPDMSGQKVWIVAEIPAFSGSKLVRYETFVWYAEKGQWSPHGLHRASRWIPLPLPPKPNEVSIPTEGN